MKNQRGISGIQVVVVAAIVAIAFTFHHMDKKAAVEKAVTQTEISLNKEYQKRLDAASALAREKEGKIASDGIKIQKDKDDKIKRLNSDLQLALDVLRDRPQRPSAGEPSNSAGDSKTCTGRELYKEDAEFLTREAARAEELIVERDFYYEKYESVRKRINGITK